MNLNSQTVGPGVGAARFADGAFSDCCDRLSDSVGYTTKDLKETSGVCHRVCS